MTRKLRKAPRERTQTTPTDDARFERQALRLRVERVEQLGKRRSRASTDVELHDHRFVLLQVQRVFGQKVHLVGEQVGELRARTNA